jgi:hypothetical protein
MTISRSFDVLVDHRISFAHDLLIDRDVTSSVSSDICPMSLLTELGSFINFALLTEREKLNLITTAPASLQSAYR